MSDDKTGDSTTDADETAATDDHADQAMEGDAVSEQFENAPRWPEEEQGTPPVRNGLAVAALVLGIIAIPGIYLLGIIDVLVIVLAIVFGIISLRNVRRGTCTRKGFAITGIVGGGVGVVLLIVAIIVSQHAVNDCKDKLGKNASDKQVQQCLNNKRKSK